MANKQINAIMKKCGKGLSFVKAGGVSALYEKVLKAVSPQDTLFGGSMNARVEIFRNKIAYRQCRERYDRSSLPEDFPFFATKGRSVTGKEILISPHTNNYKKNYLIVINEKGELLKYRRIDGFAYAFRKYRFGDGTAVYAYLQTEDRFNGSFDNTRLVILNEQMDTVLDEVSMVKDGSIEEGHPFDNHEYVILGPHHYIGTCVENTVVRNVPGQGDRGVRIIDSVIQEQKDGQVLFRFRFSEHPELTEAAFLPGNWEEYIDNGEKDGKYADCAHLNSVEIDPKDGNWLLSYRSVGLVKVSRTDGRVLWVMGRKRCDIKGVSKDDICLCQHDARYQKDGSITVFDNYGSPHFKSRICRYKIDEDALRLLLVKHYETKIKKSEYMGGAQLTDDKNEVFEITYGSSFPYIAFEEYDFRHKRQNMKLVFEDGYDLYQVFAGERKVQNDGN